MDRGIKLMDIYAAKVEAVDQQRLELGKIALK